jgi:hypothetical protein
MRFVTLASGFFVSSVTFAQAMPCMTHMGCPAPAPAIGSGVPVALAAAAVLCGTMLLKLWRRS